MKKKSIVLLSSGLDSSVNFLVALRRTDILLALTFDYGQRAVHQEIKHSKLLCDRYGIKHKVIELPWLRDITKTSLVNTGSDIPVDVEIDALEKTKETARAVWVPNRNGVFLNIAASFADSLKAQVVVPGFNKEEAVTFPDNSEDYLDAATTAFSYSTQNHVEVECYTSQMDKPEIARLGRELGLDFSQVWACYFGGSTSCGVCESCLRFNRAMKALSAQSRLDDVIEASTYFS